MNGKTPKYIDKKEAMTGLFKMDFTDKDAQNIFVAALNSPMTNIKQLGLKYLNDSIISFPASLKNKLIDMAKNDPIAKTRGLTLNHLFDSYKADASQIAAQENALNDSSYYVISMALSNVLNLDAEKGRTHIPKMLDLNKKKIMMTVAKYFGESGVASDNSFFTSRLEKDLAPQSYAFMNHYSDFLILQNSNALIELALPVIEKAFSKEEYYGYRITYLKGFKYLQWNYEAQLKDWNGTAEDKQTSTNIKTNIDKIVERLLADEESESLKEKFEKFTEKHKAE